MLPTPTATNAHQGTQSKAGGNSLGIPLLPMAALTWPTPCARDYRSGRQESSRTRGHSPNPPEMAGGMLNPPWVEWLMGFPLGSTACMEWETLRSPSAPQLHGNY